MASSLVSVPSDMDQGNAYCEAMSGGREVPVTAQGANAHIDAMAKKYIGHDVFPFRQPGEQSLILKIEARKVTTAGWTKRRVLPPCQADNS